MRLRAISVLMLAAAIIWSAPLFGLAAAGHPFLSYLGFAPRTQFVPHPSFECSAFVTLLLAVAGALALYCVAIAHTRRRVAAAPQRRFPWWGWLGLGLIAASWFFALHYGFVPPEWRRHVFTPLWLAYILMNALAFRHAVWARLPDRTGQLPRVMPLDGG